LLFVFIGMRLGLLSGQVFPHKNCCFQTNILLRLDTQGNILIICPEPDSIVIFLVFQKTWMTKSMTSIL